MSVATADLGPYRGPQASQPWNRVVWPSVSSSGVWDPLSAMALPSVGRAVALIAGQIRQCPLDDYAGVQPQSRSRFLDQPDPAQARAWFVGQEVSDYLLHGNGLSYVTARDATGYPAATVWLPASWVSIAWDPGSPDYGSPTYWVGGRQLDSANVVHVKRGADDRWPVRGIGVVEQHLLALARVANTERYEATALSGAGVPSVAIITPNSRLSPEEAASAKEDWLGKFAGPERSPAILPAGTQVIPLAWSPEDAQLNEARKLNLQDVANMFNLDGYYLGAEAASLTYRSPGPLFLQLLRITLEPIMGDFEGVWSSEWLPRGHVVRFDRQKLLVDDLQNTVTTLSAAVTSGLMTLPEARVYMGLPPTAAEDQIPGEDLVSTTSNVATEGDPNAATTEGDPSDVQAA